MDAILRKSYPTDLSGVQWAIVAPLLPLLAFRWDIVLTPDVLHHAGVARLVLLHQLREHDRLLPLLTVRMSIVLTPDAQAGC